MHVGVIFPMRQSPDRLALLTEHWREAAPPEMAISARAVEHGPDHVLTESDISASAPHVAELAAEFSTEVDALVVSCVLDPGVTEARHVSRVPVIGPGGTLLMFASQADRFAITTPVAPDLMSAVVASHGCSDRVTSIRQVPPETYALLRADPVAPAVVSHISADMSEAIHQENAQLAVMMCCGFPPMRSAVQEKIGAPTLAPLTAALTMAQQVTSIAVTGANR